MPGLTDLVDECIQSGEGDPAEIATQILDSLDFDRLRTLVAPMFYSAVRDLMRARTRRVEAQAFRQSIVRPAPGPNESGQESGHNEGHFSPTTPTAMARLLKETFVLSDGRRVSWGEATVEDHQERADMLRDHISTVEVSLARHETAIEMIRDAKVTCLAEIGAEKPQRKKKAA